MRSLLPVGAVLAVALPAAVLWAQDAPVSLVTNGGFERVGGWNLPANATIVNAGRTGRGVQVVGDSLVAQDIPVDNRGHVFSCSVDVRAENVVPIGAGGHVYAAVYQLNGAGQWISFNDPVIITGTADWKRYTFTFELVPRAEIISVRCGIWNCTGKAWFDSWTCVEGPRAYDYEEIASLRAGENTRPNAVAVFREPGFPARGAASSPERLGQVLERAGLEVTYLSAAGIADPHRLDSGRFAVLVLPYGQSFPAAARQAVTDYLQHGGCFISTGGYAFNNLLLSENGTWADEKHVLARRIEEASARSLLPDGGFETTTNAPVGGTELDGKWRRDSDADTIVEETSREGRRCARIAVVGDRPRDERWYLDLRPERGATYRLSGWIRTRDVSALGVGFAYMAVYEYDDQGELLPWTDFTNITGTHDWAYYSHDFTPDGRTTRLHVKLGIYSATGTAWYDDIRLVDITDLEQRPMNTATGKPADALTVAPWQIGVFDAGFALRRAVETRPGAEQHLFASDQALRAPLQGWAASGVLGYDNARWVELLDCRDRFGRKRGAAGALMLNYGGFFAGSMWGFFGVENRDLFDGSAPWLDAGLVNLAKFMARGLFLRSLGTDLASYLPGEPVKRSVVVENYGAEPRSCLVQFAALPEGDPAKPTGLARVQVLVPSGESRTVESVWQPTRFRADLYQVSATLVLDGQPVDGMRSGFVVQRERVAKSGPQLEFRDNYFRLARRPMFLFGSGNWSNAYNSASENPWTWHLDLASSVDFGFNLYENLQYSQPDLTLKPEDWRKFEGMAQLCQKHGLVFMPGSLIGQNVAIGEETLAKQAALCTAYGEHMRRYPALLYYLNGDFQSKADDTASLTELWNQWLADKHTTPEALAAAWGDEVYGDWGKRAYPPPLSSRWDSARECDHYRFEVWLVQRWVARHVTAVRSADSAHPITSEYYQQPTGGIDLPLTIGDQDVSNIGYFGGERDEIDRLPLHLRLNDLRIRGASLGLGEYGVKTHPAWNPENDPVEIHGARPEEEQKRLFMAVAHYGFGMGACKVQNWCLKDASQLVFPWGVFYPNHNIPKDVAFWHRNLSLVWRHFTPRSALPRITVLLPDSLRLGTAQPAGIEVPLNAFRALLGLHAQFSVLDETHAEALPAETRCLIWPSPTCPDDAAYAKVLAWARAGGKLIVTGDLTRDPQRKRTRAERLEELCGVRLVSERYPPPIRPGGGAQETRLGDNALQLNPCLTVTPTTAQVLASTAGGEPVVFSNQVGSGTVVYCTDPLELGPPQQVLPSLRALYRTALGEVLSADPLARTDVGPDVHLCRQPLQSGGEFISVVNTNQPPGAAEVALPGGAEPVRLRVAARYPGMVATSRTGQVIALGASGEAWVGGRQLLAGDAQVICLSLDDVGLHRSSAVLLCPFSTGKAQLRSRRAWRDPVVLLGDIVGGSWRTYEVRRGQLALSLDEDTMTCLALLCEKREADRWTAAITRAVRHPERVQGY